MDQKAHKSSVLEKLKVIGLLAVLATGLVLTVAWGITLTDWTIHALLLLAR